MDQKKFIPQVPRALVACFLYAMSTTIAAQELTFGNTMPFEDQGTHQPDFVLGVQVAIPVSMELTSFGLMYGHEDQAPPLVANAVFGLYSSDGATGLPSELLALTDPVNLSDQQTYDHIPFATSPWISAGTYWMMGLYESNANTRANLSASESLVAYWPNAYEAGMPATAPDIETYTGQNFNYWINGMLHDAIFQDRFELQTMTSSIQSTVD